MALWANVVKYKVYFNSVYFSYKEFMLYVENGKKRCITITRGPLQ